MLLIPGFELRKGHIAVPKPVHDKKEDPLMYLDAFDTIKRFVDIGARRVHLIDTDGAHEGQPVNVDIIQQLRKNHPNLEIEVTGGIKSIAHAELWLDVGASFVVLTWKMMRQRDSVIDLCGEYPGAVIVSIEAREGLVNGSNGAVAAEALIPQYEEDGAAGVFYSEMHAPGDRRDPLPYAAALAKNTSLPVVCNGGVHAFTTADLLRKKPLSALAGVVIGRALLTGGLDYAELLTVVKQS